MRTRLSICRKKARYPSEEEARTAATRSGLLLLPYLCDRCRQFHLTSRTKGKRLVRDGKRGGQAAASALRSAADPPTPAASNPASIARPRATG